MNRRNFKQKQWGRSSKDVEGSISQELNPAEMSSNNHCSDKSDFRERNVQADESGFSGECSMSFKQQEGVFMFPEKPLVPALPTYDVPFYRQLATIHIPNQAKLLLQLNLCSESDRIKSFTGNWPSQSTPPLENLAASGWFYLGNLDRTQCFCCGGVLRNWRRLDNPNTEHLSHFPHCLMAQGRESRNIPIHPGKQTLCSVLPQNKLSDRERQDLLALFPCNFPATPSMRSANDRLTTFTSWHFTRATPTEIAETGFYSLGVRDRVKCFYCNGGLQNWQTNDDPWSEHAKWYSTCEFLLQQKGPEFVHMVVVRFPNINRPMLRAPSPDGPSRYQFQHNRSNSVSSAASGSFQEVVAEKQTTCSILKNAMTSTVAESVICMGFDEKFVKQAMLENIEKKSIGHTTARALVEAVQELERIEEANNERVPARLHKREEIADVKRETSLKSNLHCQPNDLNSVCKNSDNQESMDVSEILYPSSFSSSCIPGFPSKASPSPNGLFSAGAMSHGQNDNLGDEKNSEAFFRKTLNQLQIEKLCKVCLDKDAAVLYMPCGHICCCMECSQALRLCPICRQKIDKAMKTYMS